MEARLKYIQKLRAEGKTWKEVYDEFTQVFEYDSKVDSLKRWYLIHNHELENDLENTVDAIKAKRRSQKSAQKANAAVRALADDANLLDDVLDRLQETIKKTPVTVKKYDLPKPKSGTPIIVEALLSDLQIGKMTPDFNCEIARKRLQKYGESLLFKLNQHIQNKYKPQRIILALLGDLIESLDKAAKKGSPLSVEVSTPEQIVLAIRYLHEYVIAPLAETGIELEVIGVPGNHDGTENGMIMDKAGKQLYTWVIYNSLQMLSEKYKNVKFNITPGIFATTEIFGHTVVYEHGYGISVSETNLLTRANQRGRQLKKHVTYFRMGDKHSISRFNEDTLVVNGAFFGISPGDKGEEYSSALGYASNAGQIVFFHVPREDERLPCYDSFIIQLNHIH